MGEKKKKKWYSISVDKKKKHADIHLFGVIGGYRLNIHKFLDELAPYKDLKTIHVYISTVGGTFNDGLPIYNILKQHKAKVTTINMGYALSMGSQLMLAGDRRLSAQNALQMLHYSNGVVCDYVNAEYLRKELRGFEAHDASMMPRYQEILGLPEKEIDQILKNETWYTSKQALDAGLIHEIIDPIDLPQIDDQMSVDMVENTAKMLSYRPPDAFITSLANRFNSKTDAIETLKKLPESARTHQEKEAQSNTNNQEDDDMTQEQLDELKASITTAINAAVKAEVASALTKTEESLNASLQEKFDNFAKDAKPSEAITTKLDENLEASKALKTAQQAQNEKLDKLTDTVSAIQELPVNTPRIEQHGNRNNSNDVDDENKATYS